MPGGHYPHRRRDLQILRGIAVLGVMLAHFGSLIPGGFLGVDVFFVISGFVITLSLFRLRQRRNEAKSLLREFWLARFWRLIPALVVVIIATLILSLLLLRPTEFREQVEMSIWSLFFAANIGAEVQSSAGYFDIQAKENWFLHLWSLGVEEQFYLFFPLLFLLVFPFLQGNRSRKSGWWILGGVAGMSIALSLVDDVFFRIGHSDTFESIPGLSAVLGYYSPATRAWQLLAGVIAAFLVIQPRYRPRAYFGSLGLAVIIGSMVLVPGSNLYPGPLTLVPTAGAFLITLFPLSRHLSEARILNFLKWLGDRSYSAYLWHWPIWLALSLMIADLGVRIGMAFTLTLALAEFTHRFVEEPLRHPIGRPEDSPTNKGASESSRRPGRIRILAFFLPGFILVALVPLAIDESFEGNLIVPNPPDFFVVEPSENCVVTECSTIQEVLILGDSHAGVISRGVAEKLELLGVRSSHAILEGCLHLVSQTITSANSDCREASSRVVDLINENDPGIVILHGYTAGHFSPVFSGRNQGIQLIDQVINTPVSPEQATNAYHRALDETLQFLIAQGITVVLVSGIPDFDHRPDEAMRNNRPLTKFEYLLTPWLDVEFGQTVTRQEFLERNRSFRSIERELFAALPDGVIVDPWLSLCEPERCRQIRADGSFVYSDWDHLSPESADALAETIVDEIASLGLLRD